MAPEKNIETSQTDLELDAIKVRLHRIKEKYSDPRIDSWDKEDIMAVLKERLHMEVTIEKIIAIIAEGGFTVAESERIFAEARKRISISVPVKIIPSHQDSLIEDDAQDSRQDTW